MPYQYGPRQEYYGFPGGPPPRRGLYGAGNRNRVITLIGVIVGFSTIMFVVFVHTRPENAAAMAHYYVLIFAIIVPAVIFSAAMGAIRIRRPRPVPVYDVARYNLFRSSLDALSLGVGVQAPGLVVMESGFPDAWVQTFGAGGVIAVSPGLLSMSLTDQEIEGIMAASLARMIDQRMVPSWPDIYKELDPDADIIAQAQDITLGNRASYCIWSLRADTLAARLTGQPHTLQSAITKVGEVLDRMPQRFAYPSPLWFVEPLVVGPFMRSGSKIRTELTRLRLENLERIEAGQRPDFSELRDGRPVVGPKGWE